LDSVNPCRARRSAPFRRLVDLTGTVYPLLMWEQQLSQKSRPNFILLYYYDSGGSGDRDPGLRIGSYAFGSELTDRRKVLTTRTGQRCSVQTDSGRPQTRKCRRHQFCTCTPSSVWGRIQVSYCLIQSHFESAAAVMMLFLLWA
jgi:hypothetical protein